eukprot:g2556.t1
MDELEDYDMQVKLLMIGDSGVGKTCLLLRYAQDAFSKTFITTIGIDFKNKLVDYKGKKIRLQIWDTAGQERFRTITQSYFRGAQGILLCYDITDANTFVNVNTWIDSIRTKADASVTKILVGNKCDMESFRKVSKEEGEAVAKKFGMSFFETSAKEDINVKEAFKTVAHSTVDRILATGQKLSQNTARGHVAFSPSTSSKKKCC